MFRMRILILLGLSFLAASAAWADDVGFVDCSAHSEGTPVFGKPRKSPDVVATVPCGERFTILVYGFVFSQIQTSDGRVGYVYSSVIALDRSATSVQRTGSVQMASVKTKIPSGPATAPAAKPNLPTPAQPQPAPAQVAATQPVVAQASAPATPASTSSASVSSTSSSGTAEVTMTSAPIAPAQPPSASAPSSSTQPVSEQPPAPAQPAPAPVSVAASSAPASPAPVSNPPEPAATISQPTQPAAAPPDPAPAPEPAARPIRPASSPTSWEKPLPSVRTAPLMEFFGGYSFARLPGGGPANNLNGALGSFGWSLKPWLQLTADTSYNYVNVTGGKYVIYGNHYGPRFFRRGRNRWGITPFAEALVGGSRLDTTVTGAGGYTTSTNCLSYKVGGGLDIHPSRRWDIRVFDVDYYRTAFGTGLHQNNYWASAGVVLRLFGGRE